MMDYTKSSIAVIGLGYVGLPLAVAFSKKRKVLAFDINRERVINLLNGVDDTLEVNPEEFTKNENLLFSNKEEHLKGHNIFIVTVPTPIDADKKPDLKPLISATSTIGKYIQKDSLIIYESTVFPGTTEEICVPILEEVSGLKFNSEFYCGYSPERINPGDKSKNLSSITKIVSGSTPDITESIEELYSSIVDAGTFKVSSMKIAEAAKVIENTQRDLNIALINELSMLFNKLDLDTNEILDAAETKWNFVPFRPGLVGGHCIGVDPYYLTFKAEQVGYKPELILAGRKINDAMPSYIVEQVKNKLLKNSTDIENSEILILGLSFKENCRDIRNTKVANIVDLLESENARVNVYDPWVNKNEAEDLYKIKCLENLPDSGNYSAIIIAVAHEEFKELELENLRKLLKANGIIYDVKSIFPQNEIDGAL